LVKKIILRLIGVGVLAGAAYGGYRAVQGMQTREQVIATTKVRKGDVVVRSYARGELRAMRSVTLTAPNLFGTVQVTRLAPLGSFAREKDLVVEFDDSEVLSRLEEKQLELDQIDEQIKKAQADLAIRNNQDQVDLLNAKYGVRRAELEVKRNELLAAIDAKKNLLNLEEAKKRLSQLESDIKSRQEQALAQLAVMQEKKNKGILELDRERRRLSQVKLLSPISGLVAVKQNRGNFMFAGMQVPDIREGDQVQPGIPVADILDLSELEVIARVGELDRANLHEGQEVLISLDAISEQKLHGKIKTMSGTASSNPMSFDPAKRFDVIFSIDMRELLGALGAKTEQINKIIATAEQNRKKPIAMTQQNPMAQQMMAAMAAGGAPGAPGGPGGMPQLMQPGGPGGPPGMQGEGQGGPEGRGGRGGRGNRGDGAGKRGEGDNAGKRGERGEGGERGAGKEGAPGGRGMPDFSKMTPEEQKKMREAMQRRMAGGGGRGGPEGMQMPSGMGMGGSQQFTAKDIENAKLPPPPGEDTQFDVLLRPGLLADVEIIVDKIPNALSLPMQAIFEKDNKPIVYVKKGPGSEYEARVITPLKRSESTMVIASGVNEGDVVLLADPTVKKGKNKKDGSKQGGGAMGALPGGGKQ